MWVCECGCGSAGIVDLMGCGSRRCGCARHILGQESLRETEVCYGARAISFPVFEMTERYEDWPCLDKYLILV